MKTLTLILLAAAALTGAALAWLIRKLVFERVSISRSVYEQVLQELQQANIARQVLEASQQELKTSLSRQEEKLQGLNQAYIRSQQELTEAATLRDSALKQKEEVVQQIKVLQEELTELRHSLQQKDRALASLQATKESMEEKLQTQKADFENIRTQLEKEFQLLAAGILERSSQKFNEEQEKNLRTLLNPLKEKIAEFRTEIEQRYNDETKERSSLRTELRQIMELNTRLTKEAESLSNALRGSTKQQGDWGEAILERILEYVGFSRNLHYTVQESGRTEDGARIRPDVLLRYPDNRVVIIDSKVSLVHYEQYCNATSTEEQETACAQLVRSLRAHIDGLAGKKYHELSGTLDSVMMFVPVEAAFITASQADPSLWQHAYDRGIIVLSPTILLGAMKLIYDYWKRDEINRNAEEVAKKAGALYDKLVGFVTNLEEVGRHLSRAQEVYASAFGQLSSGKGNLIAQAAAMHKLKIHAKKQLPAKLVEKAEDEANG